MNWFAVVSKRLWFGLNPELRKSRFHTQKGQFTLNSLSQAADFAAAVATGVLRRVAGVRPVLPWITFPAMRFLRERITPNTRVFEWGSGMSTLWFERYCAEVWAVEDNPVWYATIAGRAKRAKVVLREGKAYVDTILEFPPGYFDVVSVDGSHRLECFRLAVEHVRAGALLVVDNTDNDRTTGGELFVIDEMLASLGSRWDVHRFPGWGPGNFFAWETTICVVR
jgi:hypothetical protein